MRHWTKYLAAPAAALGFAPLGAGAAPLAIVNVGAPAINCVFSPTCTLSVLDNVGTFVLTGDEGIARLQSRTFTAAANVPAAGAGGYMYRIDMTGMSGGTVCVNKLAFDFGPAVKLPYGIGAMADIYVVTSGGVGSAGPASAEQTGATVTLSFVRPICPGETSYFIGLASKSTMPKLSVATLGIPSGDLTASVTVP